MSTITIKVEEVEEQVLDYLREAGVTIVEDPDNYCNDILTFPEGTSTHTDPMRQHYTTYPSMFGIDPYDIDKEYDGTWQEDYYRINGFIFEHSYGTYYDDYEEVPFNTFRVCVIPIPVTPVGDANDDHPF